MTYFKTIEEDGRIHYRAYIPGDIVQDSKFCQWVAECEYVDKFYPGDYIGLIIFNDERFLTLYALHF